jgi:tRNA(fMet)-specific endonuclease VapC
MKLLDSGIIIDMLREKEFRFGFISPLILIELLRGIDAEKRTSAKELLEKTFSVINIDNKIIETYCELYHKLKEKGAVLPDADLLIAATAIAYDLSLETNDNHFQRLEAFGLKISNSQ